MSCSSAASSRSSCSSAASFSIENVHSYGYETNGMRSWRRIAAGSWTSSPRGVGDAVGPLGAHDPLAVEQAGGLEGLEVAQPIGRERAEDVIARIEDSALGIAERSGLEPGGRVLSGHAAEK